MLRSIELSTEEILFLNIALEVYRMQGLRGAEGELFRDLSDKLAVVEGEGDGWLELESSNLKAARYNAAASRLDIEFRSGARWHYLDVPAAIWEGLQEAESKGRYFGAEIKDTYTAVPEADPSDEAGE